MTRWSGASVDADNAVMRKSNRSKEAQNSLKTLQENDFMKLNRTTA